MKKSGGVLIVIGIVAAVLVAILLIAGIYFYNFYVFKTVRVCIGDAVDTGVSCGVTQDCIDKGKDAGFDFDLGDAPDFIRDNLQKILDEVVHCSETCFVKNVRGIDIDGQKLVMLDNCEVGEVEFVVEIRGKDGLEIWKYLKSRGENV